jgi:hypothetical protein
MRPPLHSRASVCALPQRVLVGCAVAVSAKGHGLS